MKSRLPLAALVLLGCVRAKTIAACPASFTDRSSGGLPSLLLPPRSVGGSLHQGSHPGTAMARGYKATSAKGPR